MQCSHLVNEFEFEGGAFFGPRTFFEACDLFDEIIAARFEFDLCVERTGRIEGDAENGADEVLPDLCEVEAVERDGEAVGIGPVGFVKFVVKDGVFGLAGAFEKHEEMLAGELWDEAEVVFIDARRFDGDVQDVDAGHVVGSRKAQSAWREFVYERHAADVLIEMAALFGRESIGELGKQLRFGECATNGG